ncbi:alpha-hydroxy acid oxidase [Variovorax sp. HJSM1_2]|uniref:alpha-hydroxy acid oxidase n=1 Tax=Variovorax sp. HJSM1_2 TaxID=3366263 RepID=UPI003BE7B3FC
MRSLARTYRLDDFEALARRQLPRAVYEFYAGGAEDESALRRNLHGFAALALAPRLLQGVASVETAVPLLGATARMPVVIAPMGAVGFGRRGGDLDLARAAAAAGVPYVLSTTATASIETIASQAGGRLWFQLYPLLQKQLMWQLVERARVAGFEALVLTADVPVGGKRERDLRNDFSMPFKFTPRNLLDFASRPRWALEMCLRGLPVLENLKELAPPGSDGAAVAASVGAGFDPGFDWHGLAQIRQRWPGQLVLKGVLHAADARRAAQLGCDAVVVSNHGGRQLDSAPAAIDALPGIVAEAGSAMTVLVDGGVRRGADVVKALALGADGVMLGRPALFGACVAGQAGVERVLDILRDELERTLKLCGVAQASAIAGADLLARPGVKAAKQAFGADISPAAAPEKQTLC